MAAFPPLLLLLQVCAIFFLISAEFAIADEEQSQRQISPLKQAAAKQTQLKAKSRLIRVKRGARNGEEDKVEWPMGMEAMDFVEWPQIGEMKMKKDGQKIRKKDKPIGEEMNGQNQIYAGNSLEKREADWDWLEGEEDEKRMKQTDDGEKKPEDEAFRVKRQEGKDEADAEKKEVDDEEEKPIGMMQEKARKE